MRLYKNKLSLKSHRNNKKTRKYGRKMRSKKQKGGTIFKPESKEDLKKAVNAWDDNRDVAEKMYGHISKWDTSKITDMSGLFSDMTDFNEDISGWDVSNVTNMESMFHEAESFNQPINNWDVSKVTNMAGMFAFARAFNQPIGEWNVSNVTDMESMFQQAESFNQPIGKWKVSNVVDMSYMFLNANAFNQPIDNWDVSNVVDMESMFSYSGYTKELPNVEDSKQRNIRKDLHHLKQVFKNKPEYYTPGLSELTAQYLGATKDQARDLFNISNIPQQPGGKRKTRKMRKSKKI